MRANDDLYGDRIGEAGTMPPRSLIGVERLVLPGLLLEIEALAGA